MTGGVPPNGLLEVRGCFRRLTARHVMLCKPDQKIGPGSFQASLYLPYQLWRLAAASRPSFDLAELGKELRIARSKGISGRRVDLGGKVATSAHTIVREVQDSQGIN